MIGIGDGSCAKRENGAMHETVLGSHDPCRALPYREYVVTFRIGEARRRNIVNIPFDNGRDARWLWKQLGSGDTRRWRVDHYRAPDGLRRDVWTLMRGA